MAFKLPNLPVKSRLSPQCGGGARMAAKDNPKSAVQAASPQRCS
jgi:hypothetical protein